MKTAFPIACYRPGIADATAAVFQTMLGLAVEQRDAAADRTVTGFTAAVYYAGEWQGALLIECSAEQALHWTARQIDLPNDACLADDVRDALGELTNVLAGNLKPLLPKGVGLSMPSVVEGSDYGLHLCGGNLFERLDFADEHGAFRVTFVEVLDRE